MNSEKTNKDNEQKEGNGKEKRLLLLLLLLLLITIIAVAVSVWAIWFRGSKTPSLPPDYAPRETEINAEPIGDDDDTKLQQPEGGGAVSLTYAREVSISISKKSASLLFANPTKSNQDMVICLVIDDVVIFRSGRLTPGNKVSTLALEDGIEKSLSKGGYNGKFVVFYYDCESGEKAMVNTEIPVSVTVNE